jgi:Iron-containing redox enzyme
MRMESTNVQDADVADIDLAGTVEVLLGHPKLRENVWRIRADGHPSELETLRGTFEVESGRALEFMKIRSHCTPHNSLDVIASRSGVPRGRVIADLFSLIEPGVLAAPDRCESTPSPRVVIDTLMKAAGLWGRELSAVLIGNQLRGTLLPRSLIQGWLLEMYHYIADFPVAIQFAADIAEGELREVLQRYAAEERGHERFVVRSLQALGLSPAEVQGSRPLASTRAVMLMMRSLFSIHPATALLLAHMVEASEAPQEDLRQLRQEIEAMQQLPEGALEPLFEHQAIDASLGHQTLLDRHRRFVPTGPRALLDQMVGALHDLKHMFELQMQEIVEYYGDLGGRFLPPQPVDYDSLDADS